jgi:hypothetical protein
MVCLQDIIRKGHPMPCFDGQKKSQKTYKGRMILNAPLQM